MVVYWNNSPAPYMVDRFNALADLDAFEFEAWFNERIEEGRSWEAQETNWRFRYRYVPSTPILGQILHWPWPVLTTRADIIVSLYAEPVFVVGWFLAKFRRLRTGFRVLATFDTWINRRTWKTHLKRFMFRRVDLVETTGPDGRRFAHASGAPRERIHVATHTVDHTLFSSPSSEDAREAEALRKKLELQGVVFTYVGRLWHGKGIETLLDAFEILELSHPGEANLLLVGDGNEEPKLRKRCADRGIRNVAFAGFVQRRRLPAFLHASDVFVFPTLGDPYGIAVDEAMACGLPVVSTVAAGEIRYRVEEGINGFLVPTQDPDTLAKRMRQLLASAELREEMGGKARETVVNHTPVTWAKQFAGMVQTTLKSAKPGRGGGYQDRCGIV